MKRGTSNDDRCCRTNNAEEGEIVDTLRIRKGPATDRSGEDAGSTLDTSSLSFTGRIARWSARHRWWVVAASMMMLVLAVLASSTFKVELLDDNDFLESESGEAIRLLKERFGEGGAPAEQLGTFRAGSPPVLNSMAH